MGWSGILYSPFNSEIESIYALNGTYRKRIDDTEAFEWGIDAPIIRPTIETGDSTGLTGDYNAKYTYCRTEQNTVVGESNPSTEALAAVTLSNESLKITASAPTDKQVNYIKFYRNTAADSSTYQYDKGLNYVNRNYSVCQDWEASGGYITGLAHRFTVANTTDNTEDCFTWEVFRSQLTVSDTNRVITSIADNILYIDSDTVDASLGDSAPTDHFRPPLGTYVAGPSFNGTVFIIKDNKLHFSKPKEPEYFPEDYFVDVSSIQYGGLCLIMYDKQPYFITKNKIFFIFGSTASTFLPKDMAAKTGTQSQNGAIAVEGYGIFHVGSDGVYLFFPSTDFKHGTDKKISSAFDPLFRGEDKNGMTAVGDLSTCWLDYWENKLYFGYAGKNESYPSNTIVFYLDEQRAAYYTWAQQMHNVGIDNFNNRLLAIDENGFSWQIEDPNTDTDAGGEISWEAQSKDFTLQTRQHFPRWAKYDVDATLSDSAKGYVYLDSDSHQEHVLTGKSRDSRRRLIKIGNGARLSHLISGSGPIKIYAVESE